MRANRMEQAKSLMKRFITILFEINTILCDITAANQAMMFYIARAVGKKHGELMGKKLAEYLIKKSDQDIIKPEKNVSITIHLISTFPKDWQEDLKISQERWIKQKYSSQKIKCLILKHLLYMIWVYIQIKIENIWFPKSSSTK
jgi:hypothetical protein